MSKGCCPIQTHCAYNATVMFRQSRRLSPQEQPFSSWYWTSKTPGASLADDWSNSAVVCSSFCVALSMQSFWSSPFCSVFLYSSLCAILSMQSFPCGPVHAVPSVKSSHIKKRRRESVRRSGIFGEKLEEGSECRHIRYQLPLIMLRGIRR